MAEDVCKSRINGRIWRRRDGFLHLVCKAFSGTAKKVS